ncbi:hypothetical protein MNBD_ALPHA07-193 [hydrothermal vent metagenome]|uniref:Outer membrane protein beta-barrel domain-containing protein n=1 Tax=hydrothermal vent metagenome TaxID=652676 RepID=A0A3B0RLQ4_9ZZZZ
MRVVLLMFLVLASPAQAGPWPREKGHVFLSVGGVSEVDETTGTIATFSTLYGEYGLTEKITLGLDLGSDGRRSSKAMAFLRMPLTRASKKTKLAAEMGLGFANGEKAIRPGLSIGRGFTLGKRNGWMTADSRAVIFKDFNDILFESDLTIGLSATKRLKVIMQVQTGIPAHDTSYVRLAPSIVFERKPGRHTEFGVTAGIKGVSGLGLKIGSWFEF